MDTIATTFPDIPRIYTGIAEWAACLLFIFFMPRKYDKAMTKIKSRQAAHSAIPV
jgi:hypothetical protein